MPVSQETPAPESQSEKNRMACAKRSENQWHQPLGQVRGDREEHSDTIDLDPSEFTVTRELSNGHGSGNNGTKTRATTARESARTSKDFLIKKTNKPSTSELSRVEEEEFE